MHNVKLHHSREEIELNGVSVLLVDDNVSSVQILSLMLTNKGYHVEKATSGIEALEIIPKKLPDIILLDILMPDINGYEVCTRLKENPLTHDIPVIFISSLEKPAEKVKAFEVGGVDYICKPFYLTEVSARVEKHLQLFLLQRKLQLKNEQLQFLFNLPSQSIDQSQVFSHRKLNLTPTVLHELCTSVTTIQSAAELIGYYEWSKEEKIEQLRQIQSEVRKITLLMEDIAFLSCANVDESQLNLTEFDILEFCCQLLCQIQIDLGKDYNLQTYLSVPSENISIHNPHQLSSLPSLIVRMEPRLLKMIFANLISNASRCSPKGSLIDCQFIIHDQKVDILIRDRGVGFNEDDFKSLLSPFHIGKNVDLLSNFGLSLSIVKNCVDLHKGQISAKSQLNHGSEFTVTLPKNLIAINS